MEKSIAKEPRTSPHFLAKFKSDSDPMMMETVEANSSP